MGWFQICYTSMQKLNKVKIKVKTFACLLSVLFIGILIGNNFDLPHKSLIKMVYQNDYQKLMYRCDEAMRNHFISKARSANNPNDKNAEDLNASEVALIDCHDYDVLRKKLLTFNLTELDLSTMGLEAIEKESYDLQKIVRIHEIRY